MKFTRSIFCALLTLAIASPIFATEVNVTQTDSVAPISIPQDELININDAAVKDLVKVKGMNASKARSIVTYRKKNGPFKSLQELSHVKGFTRMKPEDLKNIQDQLRL